MLATSINQENLDKRKPKIICNISDTQYDIVRYVVEKIYLWNVSLIEEDDEWDVLWTDHAVTPEKLVRMKHYQKINHFPGMYAISRKNYLAYNLNKLKKVFPAEYNFFPRTWVVPCDLGDLKSFIQSKKNAFVIVKPEASCQGRGIYLTRRIDEIDSAEKHVVQEYISKPYLIEGLKFDLRIYVLLTGCDPLRIFIHKEGLTRFATDKYIRPSQNNLQNIFMHLTNYAVNKSNPNFIHNTDSEQDNLGHKRSLQSTFSYLSGVGVDVDGLMKKIEDIIIKTICSIQPNLSHHYKSCQPDDFSNSMCFEILGFDVILDSKLKPYVLEVNHTPSFSTDSPLDFNVKKKLITDTFKLLGICPSNRAKFFKKQKEDIIKRSVTGKVEKFSREEREEKFGQFKQQRDLWENTHIGGFKKIFPVEGSVKYEKFIKSADEIWQEWTGAKINRKKKLSESFSQPKKPNLLHQSGTSIDKNTSFDPKNVFSRLSKPIIRRLKNPAGSLPSIVYAHLQKSSTKQPATVSCLNLYSKLLEEEERVNKRSIVKWVEVRTKNELNGANGNKNTEKRMKKATLREILSWDFTHMRVSAIAQEPEKNMEKDKGSN